MAGWSKEEVEFLLRGRGLYKEERAIQGGTQFILTDDTPVDWYQTGKVVVRGKETPLKKEAQKLFEAGRGKPSAANSAQRSAERVSPKRVFIVYGHDIEAREQLELILRRLRLEPIVLQNLPSSSDTIIEKLEELTAADFACVLLTPDDEGYKKGCSPETKPRARQNVVLEMGMVLARLGRKHVAILQKGSKLERPSDIDGLIYIPFEAHVNETKNHLAGTLQEAGFDIQVKDLLP